MGHNTHIRNELEVPVRVVVTHPDGKTEDIKVAAGKHHRIPTIKGQVKICMYRPGEEDGEPAVVRTLPSDISVIIHKDPEDKIWMTRSVYGFLWMMDPHDIPLKLINDIPLD